ncbi:hypothetical protein ACFWGD_02435 [Corynebacterium sp. NPDC060344]|uniref:hypothetical protein n=1 Tax=Corynebacterium sp. NPDC060344 TaxID=3347101 RepID=UPI0036476E9B
MKGGAGGGDVTVEKHWGDPDRSQVREDIGRGEMVTGIAWLTVAALVSLVLEVVYLGARVDVGGMSIPVPWTIAAGYVFNLIITRTAMLWTPNRNIALVPMWAWIAGYVFLWIWTGLPFGGDQVLGETIRSVALLIAGIVGGGWPLRHRK